MTVDQMIIALQKIQSDGNGNAAVVFDETEGASYPSEITGMTVSEEKYWKVSGSRHGACVILEK